MAITLPTFESDGQGLGMAARYGAVNPQSLTAGDAVPNALSGLGQTVERAGVERLQQVKQLQSADYLENGYGNLVSQTLDGAEQAKADHPDGKGYKDFVVGQFQAGLDDLVKNAPNPQAARQIQQRATRFRQSLETRSIGYEDQASRQAAIVNQSQTANGLINAVGNAPDTIHDVRQTLTDTVNNNPALHPADKKTLLEHLLPLAGESAARGAIESNRDAPIGERGYDQWLADAKAGKWNDLLSPEGMQSAKTYATGLSRQDVAAAEAEQRAEQVQRRAEAAQAKMQARQQAMLDEGDARTSLYARVYGTPTMPGLFDAAAGGATIDPKDIPTKDEWLKAYPGPSGGKSYLEFQDKLAGAQARAKLYDTPEAGLEAMVAGKPPAAPAGLPDAPSAAEGADQTAARRLTVQQAARVLAERRADPVLSGMSRDPAVAQAWQAAQADPGSLDKLSAAIGAGVSWQARMGMAPKDYAAFPKQRMDAIASALHDEAATPQQQVATLKGMLAAIDGAPYPDDGVKDALKANFFGALKKAGVPGVEAAEPLIRQGAPDSLVTKVLSNERVKPKLSKEQSDELRQPLQDALQDWQHVGATLSNWTGDASHAGAIDKLAQSVRNYGGNFGKDKIGEGVDAYTAGMRPVASGDLAAGMIPKGQDKATVLRGLEGIRGDLSSYLPKDHVLGVIDPRGQGGQLLAWKADRFLAGGADVRFALDGDGAHLLLPTGGGGMAEAYGSDKRPIVIPYDKVAAARGVPAGAIPANPAAPDGGERAGPKPAPASETTTVPNPLGRLIRNVPDESGVGGARAEPATAAPTTQGGFEQWLQGELGRRGQAVAGKGAVAAGKPDQPWADAGPDDAQGGKPSPVGDVPAHIQTAVKNAWDSTGQHDEAQSVPVQAGPKAPSSPAEDAAYGTGAERFTKGGIVAVKGKGSDQQEDPIKVEKDFASLSIRTAHGPIVVKFANDSAIGGAFAKALTGIDHAPVAALGFDPRKTIASSQGALSPTARGETDEMEGSQKRPAVWGAGSTGYAADSRTGYARPATGATGRDAAAARSGVEAGPGRVVQPGDAKMWVDVRNPSTILHESMHNGLTQIMRSDDVPRADKEAIAKVPEEYLVRAMMMRHFGSVELDEFRPQLGGREVNPDSGAGLQVKYAKSYLPGGSLEGVGKAALDTAEKWAQRMIAKRRPGGPR